MTDMTRYVTIDDMIIEVKDCATSCPFYDRGDGGWGNQCKYPKTTADMYDGHWNIKEDCPLRKSL